MMKKKIAIVGLILIAMTVSFNAGYLFHGFSTQGQQDSTSRFVQAFKSAIQEPGDACALDMSCKIPTSCAKSAVDECKNICNADYKGSTKDGCLLGCTAYYGIVKYPY